MFSGIVEEVGIVTAVVKSSNDMAITIYAPKLAKQLSNGDSVSVNGCCLTVVRNATDLSLFEVQLVNETLNRTNLKYLTPNAKINLECSITLNKAIGGHFVQGHIADVAELTSIEKYGNSKLLTFSYPLELDPYIVNKGYVALDGASMTVVEVHDRVFSVSLIPYTLQNTIANTYTPGSLVNLEVDVIGRYVEKAIKLKLGVYG